MSNTVDEARKRFKERHKGDVHTVEGTFPPTLKLHNKDGNPGAYVSAILKDSKSVTINGIPKRVYTLELLETNAPTLKKSGKKDDKGKAIYEEIPNKKGDIVSIFAPTRLDRVLNGVPSGKEVFIEYKGKSEFTTKQGNVVYPHTFDTSAGGVRLEVGPAKPTAADGDEDFE